MTKQQIKYNIKYSSKRGRPSMKRRCRGKDIKINHDPEEEIFETHRDILEDLKICYDWDEQSYKVERKHSLQYLLDYCLPGTKYRYSKKVRAQNYTDCNN